MQCHWQEHWETWKGFLENQESTTEADEEQENEHKDETEKTSCNKEPNKENMLALVMCSVRKMHFMVH